MSSDKFGTSVECRDGNIHIVMDATTGEWLLDALYVLGEHIAAGAKIEAMPAEANNRLGSLLRQLTQVVLAARE